MLQSYPATSTTSTGAYSLIDVKDHVHVAVALTHRSVRSPSSYTDNGHRCEMVRLMYHARLQLCSDNVSVVATNSRHLNDYFAAIELKLRSDYFSLYRHRLTTSIVARSADKLYE